jgi:preprotein translocase subunit SecG
VIFSNDIFTFVLVSNSILLLVLILNQNESTKDSSSNQNSKSSVNPLEKATWFSLLLQLVILLVQLKITDI